MSFQSAPAFSLGADLRALRKTRGLTLEAVSEHLGKSVGWISQAERDLSHPSHDDLKAFARLYDVPLSLLFGSVPAVPAEAGRIVRASRRRPIGGGDGGLVESLLSPDLTDDFEVIHSTFAPGAALVTPTERPTQEVGYLVSGTLRLWLGGDVFDLEPGDSFRIRAEPYRWENPGPAPAVAIWVIAPPVY